MAYPYGEPLENYDELEGRDSVDLLARIIYAEASTESKEGKRGVAFVIQNRKELVRNKAPHHKEFGKKATFESVILHPGQFNGAESDQMLKPVLKSKAWKDSLDIAQNLSDQDNPIGTCLWFNGVKVFQKNTTSNEKYYTGWGGKAKIVEREDIGDHVFFRVEGYSVTK